MSEAQPSVTEPKKMVSRNVALTIGIVCIILLVISLAGTFAYYTSIINDKVNTISSLNSQVASLNTQVSNENNTISSLNNQLATLQGQVSNIRILGAENSTVWINTLSLSVRQDVTIEEQIAAIYTNNSAIIPPSQNVSSLGYVSVLVSSNNTSTNVQYVYAASNGTFVGLSQWIQVGLYGIAVFPVQPTTTAYVAFTSSSGTSSFTATAIYHY
jgi:hypothetical protein